MKALSIRQPWAWLIVHGYKPVENRTWRTAYRGPLLIHAAQQFDHDGYMWVLANTDIGLRLPSILQFCTEIDMRGGIVGEVELYDCTDHPKQPGDGRLSPWFFGPCGLWLRDPQPRPFQPLRGQLGLFEVPGLAALPEFPT